MKRDSGPALLAIARAAIRRAFGEDAPRDPDAPGIDAHGAAFVTLKKRGELRGCIGSLVAHRPLREDVAANAVAAAFRDPRFDPLARHELEITLVEISVLGAPEPLAVTSRDEACRILRPGVDGVILEAAGRRATFLPQVWEDLPDPQAFLAHLVIKAGLPAHAWPADTRLQVYQAAHHAESAPGVAP